MQDSFKIAVTSRVLSRLHSYRLMNQGTIYVKVYPEGVQPIKGNNCALIPFHRISVLKKNPINSR